MTFHRLPGGASFVRLHISADEQMTEERIEKEIRPKYTTDAFFQKEINIRADALSGTRVYPTFDPAVHVIPDEQVPRRGCIYMSIDPHPRTPHAILWVLIDRWSDWYVFREMWPSVVYGNPRQMRDDEQDHVFNISEYAEAIAALEGNSLEWRHGATDREYAIYRERKGGERAIRRFMDQAGKGFQASGDGQEIESYAERYRRFGIVCHDPKKSHQAGEDAVHRLLSSRQVDDAFAASRRLSGRLWPRLHIAASCRELISEFPRHRYKLTRGNLQERDLQQEAAAFRTHSLDNARYLATSNACHIPSLESERYIP